MQKSWPWPSLAPKSFLQKPSALLPLKNRTPRKQHSFWFSGNLGFRPRDWSHRIRSEIPCYFVVFMCPELRYGVGSDKNWFLGNPFQQTDSKICSNVAGIKDWGTSAIVTCLARLGKSSKMYDFLWFDFILSPLGYVCDFIICWTRLDCLGVYWVCCDCFVHVHKFSISKGS